MYRIIGYNEATDKAGFIVHDVRANKRISDGQLTLKQVDINDLTIKVNQANPLFNNVQPMHTHVNVYDDNTLIFRGRALKPTRSMEDSGQFLQEYVFEDVQSYLLDSLQRFAEYNDTTVKEFLSKLIEIHNEQVPKYKQFKVRTVDVANTKDDSYRQVDYETTRDVIKSKLLDSLGGYIICEYKDGVNYIDYLASPGTEHKNDTPIRIGRNLKSASVAINPTKVITRLIPLGAEVDTSVKDDASDDDDTTTTTNLSGPTTAVKGDWTPAIKTAAKLMGVTLTDSAIQTILRRITQESNGSESVTNNWDSNAQAGHPSTGLLQYIQPTFDTWCVKPYTNIHNGFDQLIALFNDSNWLADISVSGGWGPTGSKRRTSAITVTVTKPKTGGNWGWPFPASGEGTFEPEQNFGASSTRQGGFHDGLDFGTAKHPGSEIHAIHGGTVTHKGYMGGLGYYFVTHSGDGYNVVYQEAFSNIGLIKVGVGSVVKTGDVVGIRDTNHLHIGITKASFPGAEQYAFTDNGTWLNPLTIIKAGLNGTVTDDSSDSKTTTKTSTATDSGPKPRITVASVNGGKDYLDIPDLQKEFDVINGKVEFDNVKDPTELLNKAKTWIKAQKAATTSWTVSALELPNYSRFKVFDSYLFDNIYVAPNQLLQVVEKQIDLTKPHESSLTIGDKALNLVNYQLQSQKIVKDVSQLKIIVGDYTTAISKVRANAGLSDADLAKMQNELGNVDLPQLAKDVEGIQDQNTTTVKQLEDYTTFKTDILARLEKLEGTEATDGSSVSGSDSV